MQLLIELHESQRADINILNYKTLPRIGYIATVGKQPIAAGFLRRVEPCYAQLDTLVSNALFGSAIRHEGVKKVVESLIMEAKRLKLQGIIAHTQDKGTLVRAEALGFHVVPQTIIALSLQEISA
jgi:hypothetical protein